MSADDRVAPAVHDADAGDQLKAFVRHKLDRAYRKADAAAAEAEQWRTILEAVERNNGRG